MGIDAVFTWVNGNDPQFRATRRRHAKFKPPAPLPKWRALSDYAGTLDATQGPVGQAQVDGRFRDMQELRYALRSVDNHAPWIDRIHIVTNGQVPDWLDTEHPRISIVPHDLIFPDPTCLPVFNSNAIELNLHRIPDLSDNFLYFNDDFFLGRPVTPADFQTADGRPHLFVEKDRPLPLHMDDSQALMGHVWAYNHTLLEDRFGKAERKIFAHTPQLYNKTRLAEMEALWPEECALTRRHKFRTAFDVAFRILYTYFMAAPSKEGTAPHGVLKELNHGLDYVFAKLGDDRTPYPEDLAAIRRQRPMFFCINDEIQTGNRALDDRLKTVMADALSSLFPDPSPYEKPTHPAPTHQPLPALAAPAPPPGGLHLTLERLELGPQQTDASPDLALSWSDGSHALAPWPPAAGTALKPDMQLLLSGTDTALLRLRQQATGAAACPERGFDEMRWLRLPIPAGKPFTGQMALDALQLHRAYEARLHAYLAPVFQNGSDDAMALFLQADRAIRAGRSSRRDLWLLDQSMQAGFDPFWAGHRSILVCLQLARLSDIPDIVGMALDSQPQDWQVLYDMAGSIMALGRFADTQAILAGFRQHPRLWRRTVAREAACLNSMTQEESARRQCLTQGLEGHPDQLRLWLEWMLLRNSAQDALAWLDAAAPRGQTENIPDYHQTRVRLLLAVGRVKDAEALLPKLTTTSTDPTDLLSLAQSLRWTPHADIAHQMVDGLCEAHPNFTPALLERSAMEISRGQDLTRTIASLRHLFPQRPDHRHSKICLLIKALLLNGETKDALAEMQALISDAERLPQLTDMLHAVIREGPNRPHWRPNPIPGAARLLQALSQAYPRQGALHLAWAQAALHMNDCSAMVETALDRALALDGNPARIAFDRLTLLGLRAAAEPSSLPEEEKVLELLTLATHTTSDLAQIRALATRQPNPEFRLIVLNGLRTLYPEYLPAILNWADQALTLNVNLHAIPAALAQALKAGADPYQLHVMRFRLALSQSDGVAAEAACRAALSVSHLTGPIETALSQHPPLPAGPREAIMQLCRKPDATLH